MEIRWPRMAGEASLLLLPLAVCLSVWRGPATGIGAPGAEAACGRDGRGAGSVRRCCGVSGPASTAVSGGTDGRSLRWALAIVVRERKSPGPGRVPSSRQPAGRRGAGHVAPGKSTVTKQVCSVVAVKHYRKFSGF